ncbi:hypothetical protein GCM10025859_31660 [Alicyclobacillus fastidiosus]|nr:hypothetical protein GCM10025859_31660 [Alicyclobacillus fastidiosus]
MGVTIPATPGMDNQMMLNAILKGNLHGMYLMGEDMAWVDTNSNHVHEALSQLDFFVVQDVFLTKTAQFADVVLPASPSLEKEGTFTNTERRIQRLYQVLEPLGESKPDWEIITAIANRMGAGWTYRDPGEVMAEAAALSPIFAGVSYERLEGYQSLLWPVASDGTDTPRLYMEGFAHADGKARLVPANWIAPAKPAGEFDLHLNNGRLLEHFHEGNMTDKSSGLREKVPDTFVEVSVELAQERGICDGSLVLLESPYGKVKVHVVVTDRVHGKELYLPMNTTSEASAVNLLTGPTTDTRTNTPAYKETFVRMQVLREKGRRPLRKNNPRFGKRNPQQGVEVWRKWNRPGYVSVQDKALEVTDHGEAHDQR